jgi:signal transduction histidine kinase
MKLSLWMIFFLAFLIFLSNFFFWGMFQGDRLRNIEEAITGQVEMLEEKFFLLKVRSDTWFEDVNSDAMVWNPKFFRHFSMDGQEHAYSKKTIKGNKKEIKALVQTFCALEKLSAVDKKLITQLMSSILDKLSLVFNSWPFLESATYSAPNFRFVSPWKLFPPPVHLDWVPGLERLGFEYLKGVKANGWQPVFSTEKASNWLLSYVAPHKEAGQVHGFFALTVGPQFFQNNLKKAPSVPGRMILLDSENQQLFFREGKEITLQIAALKEVLPGGFKLLSLVKKSLNKFKYQSISWISGYWVLSIPIKNAPFRVFFYCSSWDLMQQEMKYFLHIVFFEILIFLFLLALNYGVLNRFFLQPLGHLMSHLNQERLGSTLSLGALSGTWSIWARFISTAFQEKRDLIADLENRLQERSSRLRETIAHLQMSQKQIIAQEKLAGIGTLATGIAHELRNPLHLILNFATIARDETKVIAASGVSDAARDSLLEASFRIIAHAEQATALLNHIIFQTRDTEGTMDLVDLGSLVKEYGVWGYQGFLEDVGSLPLIVLFELIEEPVSIVCVSKQMSRAFLNIFRNSFEAVLEKFKTFQEKDLEGGTPYVARIVIRLFIKKSKAILEIEDNGPGIPPSAQDRILDPFFTTKSTNQGTGLGLSMSADFIQRTGGNLGFRSAEKQGTIFTLEIPLASHESS